MNNDEGRIGFSVELDNSNLRQQIANSQRAFEQLADNVESDGARMDSAIGSIGNTLAGLGAAYSLKEFATKVADVRGEFQKLQVAMETMLQSKTKADALMAQMVQTAATTPFDLMQVTSGAKQLLAYGLEADKVNETLIRLGDIAAGLSIPLGDMVYLYGTTMTQGRLYTQDFNQFVGRGIPLISELAKQFGVAESQVKGLVEEGKVGFPEIQKVIENLTNDGGMFGGLMDKQSKTISGQIANIEDAFDMMFNEIGQNNEGMINSALSGVSTLVENYETVATALGTLVASYGVYKAALMAVTAYTNSAYSYEISQLKAVVADKTMEIDADLQSAVTKGRMTASRAQEVQALRLELAAKIASAKATAVEAEAEANAATTKRMKAQLAVQAAQAEVEAKEAEIFAMEGLGATQTVETLQKEKDVLVTKLHAAQTKLDTATKVEAAAKTNAATTAQTVNTLTTQKDTIAKKTNGAATTFLTLCTNGLTKAMNALKAAWASNPAGIILMGLTLVAGAVMTVSSAIESSADSVSNLSEKYGESIDKTVRSVDTLFTVINNSNPTSKTHENAINELCQIYEEYGIKIDEECDKLDQLNDKREEAIRLIREEGEERMNANLISSYNDAIDVRMEAMSTAIQEAFQNAEWEGSGYLDDWDAGDFQDKAAEATKIVTAMVESQIGEIRKLSIEYDGLIDDSDRQKAVDDLTSKISKALEEIGLKGLAFTDIHLSDYIRAAADDTEELASARDKLANSMRNNADAADDEAAAVDVTTMSFDDLFKAAYDADEQITTTKENLQMLGEVTATPSINTSSLDNAINQTNTLINNMLYLNGQTGLSFQVPTHISLPKSGLTGGFQSFGFHVSSQPLSFNGSNTNLTSNNSTANAQNELERRVITAMQTRQGTTDMLKDVNKALQTAGKGSADEKRLIALQNRLEAQQQKFRMAEGKGGKSSSRNNTETAAERAAKIQKAELEVQKILQESSEARKQMQRELQQEQAQQTIDLEENAAEKKRKQLALDQQKEQDQLKQQEEAAIKAEKQRQKQYFDAVENTKAARNKNYVKKSFTDEDVDQAEIDKIKSQYSVLSQNLQEQQKHARTDFVVGEFESMREFLQEYGTPQQQKLAITKDYEQKINDAQTEGEKLSLQKERDSKLSNIEAQELKANIDWATVFGDFGGIFKDVIAPSLESAKEYTKTDQFKNSDQASQKALIEAIQQMEQSLGGADKVSFKKLGEEITAYHKAQNNLKDAQTDYAKKYSVLEDAQDRYTEALNNGTEEEQKATKDAVDKAKQDADAAAKNVNTMQGIATNAQQTVTDTASNLKTSMSNVLGGLQKLSSGSLSGAYDGLIQFGKGAKNLSGKLGEAFGKVADALEDVPIVGWIVSLVDLFKDGASVVVSGTLDAVCRAISGIAGDVLTGDLFVSIGESLLSGISNIFDSITWGGFSSWFGNGDSDKNLERDIERLTVTNEALQYAIEELTDKLDDASMTDAVELYDRQKQLLAESEANTQEQMRRSGAAYSNGILGVGGSKSSNKKINDSMNSTEWSRISKIVGRSVNGATDFWNLTSEQMRSVAKEAPDLYAKIKDLADNGYRDAAKFMDDYIDYAKQREELENAYYEKMTSFSFDSLRDEFKECLTDMEMSAADFTENFNEMLIDSIAEALMTNKYDPMIKELYEKWAKYMENDGELDTDEIDALRKKKDDIYAAMESDREFLQSLYTGESSQSSTKQGFATASQDSIDELNGRFTAVQMDTSIIRETLTTIQANMGALNLSAMAIKQQNDEIRNISLLAIDHLENIAKNTHELYEMNERLGKIEKNTRKI
jgi:tape measure domain-containing protein